MCGLIIRPQNYLYFRKVVIIQNLVYQIIKQDIGSNTIFTAPENGMIITDVWNGNEVSIDQMHIGIGDRGTTYIVKKGQKGFFHFSSYFIPFY